MKRLFYLSPYLLVAAFAVFAAVAVCIDQDPIPESASSAPQPE